MILCTVDEIPGRPAAEVLGLARGTSIRGEMTKVLAEAREQALDRMVEDAKRMGADAVVGIRFTTVEILSNAAEILVYGTAIRL